MTNSPPTTPIVTPEKLSWLSSQEPIFGKLLDSYGPPPNWTRPPGFETLLRIILEQQVSLASAKSTYLKLRDQLGTITPARVLTLDDAAMRACYVSRQKTRYLRILAQAIQSGDLDLAALQHSPEPVVRSQLTRLTGIGTWTADVYLLFCLQAPDILPLGDVAVVNTIREYFTIDKAAMSALGEQWSPCRSTATYCLWNAYLRKQGRSTAITL